MELNDLADSADVNQEVTSPQQKIKFTRLTSMDPCKEPKNQMTSIISNYCSKCLQVSIKLDKIFFRKMRFRIKSSFESKSTTLFSG